MNQTEQRIAALLDTVRPYVQMHGGDVQLARFADGVAYLKVYGACVGCGLAHTTYNMTIGPLLTREIEEVTNVVFE